MTEAQKLHILENLNWDYDATPQELLAIVNGQTKAAAGFTEAKLFARFLERCRWEITAKVWEIERCKALYTPDVARRLRSKTMREQYDRFFAILRKEPVSFPEWSSDYCRQVRNTFVSDRWHRAQSRVLPT